MTLADYHADRMAAKAKQTQPVTPKPVRHRPTPEQERKAQYKRVAAHVQRVPVIDRLRDDGRLTDAEHRRLAHYAEQAAVANHSPVKSCLDNTIRTGGDTGPSARVISARIETGRIERDLGSLRDIAHAIAVEGKTLAQWCIDRHGGRERYDGKGQLVAIVPNNEKQNMEVALLELKFAASRIVT